MDTQEETHQKAAAKSRIRMIQWDHVVPGDVVEIKGRHVPIIAVTPTGAVTIEMPDGRNITRSPSGTVRLVRSADPDNDVKDLRECAVACGATLAQAQELLVQIYLGGTLLGEERPGGGHNCKFYAAMTSHEQFAHRTFFHGESKDHDGPVTNGHTHI